MELRHLRYFVAAAEARSLKLAAEEKLNTTQPSLSRQIRDLENEVGTPLFLRGAKGVEFVGKNIGYGAYKITFVAVIVRVRFYVAFNKFQQAVV